MIIIYTIYFNVVFGFEQQKGNIKFHQGKRKKQKKDIEKVKFPVRI